MSQLFQVWFNNKVSKLWLQPMKTNCGSLCRCRGASLQVQSVRQGLQPEERPAGPHGQTHWKEALQVRDVQHQVHAEEQHETPHEEIPWLRWAAEWLHSSAHTLTLGLTGSCLCSCETKESNHLDIFSVSAQLTYTPGKVFPRVSRLLSIFIMKSLSSSWRLHNTHRAVSAACSLILTDTRCEY